MSLILHAGASAITRDQLAALPLPRALGARHAIRPFIDDVELVDQYLAQNGLAISSEAFGVKNDVKGVPAQFFGALEIVEKARVVEGEVIRPGDDKSFALTVGLRGSYDQSLPRGLAVGSRVFVCDNLAFRGEINIHTKQTTFIHDRLPGILAGAVAKIPGVALAQTRAFEAYRNTPLKPRVGDAALVELVRRGVLNPSQLGKAIAEWDEPSHAEHRAEGKTVWTLHNAVTEAIKPANAERAHIPVAWDRGVKLSKFLDECCGL